MMHLVNPGPGPLEWITILALIVVFAYMDSWLFPSERKGLIHRATRGVTRKSAKGGGRGGSNVVAFPGGRSGVSGRKARETPLTVFMSRNQQEAEALRALLGKQGLHPIMVSRTREEELEVGVEYEVRVPQEELARARPVVDFFLMDSAQNPS